MNPPDAGHDTQTPMHEGEVPIDAALVRRLLVEQAPWLARTQVSLVRSPGTVNAIYRLGNDLCARLPRVATWAASLDRELEWLPRLAGKVSLDIPVPVLRGRPAGRYPFAWAVYRWLDGEPYRDDLVQDEGEAARDLARFVRELRAVETAGAPRGGRAPLEALDEPTRAAIEDSGGVIDTAGAMAAWTRALKSPPWDGVPVWIHDDLLRPNLLVRNGRLHAVLDFGGLGVGDPAADVVPAWSVFDEPGRRVYRQALDVDDATWDRARGYALHQAVLIIPYYRSTNPAFVEVAKRTVAQVLSDPA